MKYQGHEYCRINIEELTQIPREDMYVKLIKSARSKYKHLFPQIFNTTNPGGVGMGWVKKRFVTPDPDLAKVYKHVYRWRDDSGNVQETHWQTIVDKETGTWRAYIPATIDSNSILLENDPEYVRQFEDLKRTDPELYRAWRYGDWDIQFGAVFSDFRRSKHTFSRFYDWGIDEKLFNSKELFKIAGMDWGYNDECVILWATFDQITEKEERSFVYREKHDNHKTPQWWAEEFAKIQEKDPVDVLAMPHDAYSHLGGSEPIVNVFKNELQKLPPDKRPRIVRASKLTREVKKAAITTMHGMLADASDGKPGIQIHNSCEYLIETLPGIVYAKESGGEEIDPNCIDHALDSLFYTLLTGRRVRGIVINGAELRVKPKKSFMSSGRVAAKDMGVDIESIVSDASVAQPTQRQIW